MSTIAVFRCSSRGRRRRTLGAVSWPGIRGHTAEPWPLQALILVLAGSDHRNQCRCHRAVPAVPALETPPPPACDHRLLFLVLLLQLRYWMATQVPAFPMPKVHCPQGSPFSENSSPAPPLSFRLHDTYNDSGATTRSPLPAIPLPRTLAESWAGAFPASIQGGVRHAGLNCCTHFSGNKFPTEFPCSISVFKALLLAPEFPFRGVIKQCLLVVQNLEATGR